MTFRFRIGRSIEKETRRIALAQLDRAIRGLAENADVDGAIHDCRRSLKRTRSLLRLIRPAIGVDRFNDLDRGLRDIARGLSGSRDRFIAEAMIVALETRAGVARGKFAAVLAAGLAAKIGKGPDSRTADPKKAAASAAVALTEMRNELTWLGRQPMTRAELFAGFERVYSAARLKMADAYASADEEQVHEWRKLVQRHWRQLQLIQRIWPAAIAARISEAQRISELIGEHQDLSVVRGIVALVAGDRRHRKVAQSVMELCDTRQAELKALARPHGERLFAAGSAGLSRRLERYWRAAEDERASATAARSAPSQRR